MEERVVDENQEFLSSLLVFLLPLCEQLFHLKAPSITETSQGFTTKHLSPSTAEKPSVSTLHSNAPIPGTYIGNKWWHMGAYRPVPSWRFFFFKQKFFLPFLWQVGEFSLVCEEGREGGTRSVCSEVCSAHVALSQPFISYSNREKEILKRRGGSGICRMYLWEKKRKKGGEEWMKGCFWLHTDLAITNLQRDSIKQ